MTFNKVDTSRAYENPQYWIQRAKEAERQQREGEGYVVHELEEEDYTLKVEVQEVEDVREKVFYLGDYHYGDAATFQWERFKADLMMALLFSGSVTVKVRRE